VRRNVPGCLRPSRLKKGSVSWFENKTASEQQKISTPKTETTSEKIKFSGNTTPKSPAILCRRIDPAKTDLAESKLAAAKMELAAAEDELAAAKTECSSENRRGEETCQSGL